MPELAKKALRLAWERQNRERQKRGLPPDPLPSPLREPEAPSPDPSLPARLCVRGPETEWHRLAPGEGCQRRHPGEEDPALLETPLNDLKRPLQVWSDLLQEVIWLVPDDATAQRLLAEGKVAYFPQEVQILLEIQARWPESWREKVQKIHLAKKTFGGLVTELRRREDTADEHQHGEG